MLHCDVTLKTFYNLVDIDDPFEAVNNFLLDNTAKARLPINI